MKNLHQYTEERVKELEKLGDYHEGFDGYDIYDPPTDKELIRFLRETISQTRDLTIEQCIKYMRSGEIAGSFSEGCDCEKCGKYEKKVRKDLLSALQEDTQKV